MQADQLTEAELHIFTVIERVVSVFSLLGCVFIITTFALSKSFHKPINRLVFYASIGNMMTNVATLMARTYVAYGSSAACQFQAFLIQMFMPADAFWTLAMAVNVYLTFYYKYDAQKLRKMEIPYLLFCYGIPFVVALAYIFVRDETKGRVYGNATLWCWVQQSWDIWRIITFYGPVWVTIFVTVFIYTRAGREIYNKHKQLRDLNYTSHYDPEPLPMNDPFSSKTTEVSVTVSNAQDAIDLSPLGADGVNRHTSLSGQSIKPYSVTISAQPPPATATTTATTANTNHVQPPTIKSFSRRKATYDAHNAAWSYTKCALLFFTAMLVTWIPSSANRVYSVVKNGEISLALEYMSAFVLPLQGFWNAIIYMTTSWKACKMLGEDIEAIFKGTPSSSSSSAAAAAAAAGGGVASRATLPSSYNSSPGIFRTTGRLERAMRGDSISGSSGRVGNYHRNSKSSETESMEELANMTRIGTATP